MNIRRNRARAFVALALTAQVILSCQAASATQSAAPPPSSVPATLPAAPAPTATPRTIATAPPSATPTPAKSEQEKATATADARLAAGVATLDSLQRVDDYPLYTMRYYGAYGEVAPSVAGRRRVGHVPPSHWACSLFAALGNPESLLCGRNFDWQYSPALLLFTDPPNGYASVSMVDLAYLVPPGDVRSLTDLDLEEREALLAAPFWPFDGMNEQGLVVGMAAVPESEMPYDPDKDTIDSLLVIRKMLDHARDVDEAVAVLESYNITWDGGPALHYLIADASGHSTLIEFFGGDMVVIAGPTGSRWHAATNHLRAPLEDNGAPSGCRRYDAIRRRLTEAEGRFGASDAFDLLADVAQDNTQWSVVYDLSARRLAAAMGRDYGSVHTFCLGPGRQTSCPDGD